MPCRQHVSYFTVQFLCSVYLYGYDFMCNRSVLFVFLFLQDKSEVCFAFSFTVINRVSEITMGTVGPFSGAKLRPGHDADQSLPSSAKIEHERAGAIPPLSISAFVACSGTALALEIVKY
jgi:hypothetical protein